MKNMKIKGDGHICLVISPLKSLMIDQIQKANLYNIQAADIMSKEEMDINTITDICDINLHCSFFKPKPTLFFIFVSKNEFT
jgi:superfamily II DNA helicase RecQ